MRITDNREIAIENSPRILLRRLNLQAVPGKGPRCLPFVIPEVAQSRNFKFKISTASSHQHDDHPLSGFRLSVLRPSTWHFFKIGNIQKE